MTLSRSPVSRPDDATLPPRDLPLDATLTYDPTRSILPDDSNATAALAATLPPSPEWERHHRAVALEPSKGSTLVMIERIGSGGFGEVWRAKQRSLGRTIAVKRIRETLYNRAQDENDTLATIEEQFRLEAATTALLDHPNIIPIYDLGADEVGRPLLAMKLARGRPWNRLLLDDRERLSRADFLRRHLSILEYVAQAVAFAHSRGILHRDLKPAQVMLGEFGEVLLMDWGLAVSFGEKQSTPGGHEADLDSMWLLPTTETASSPSGTPAYMAPEQTERTGARLGPWTDVYLLGAILYEILAGGPPHQAATADQAFLHAVAGKIDPIAERSPGVDVPAELEALCLSAMKPEPLERLASASAFVEALQAYQSGASRRAEAESLLAKASEALESKLRDYRELGDLISSIDRAAMLSPENPEAAKLRQRALGRLARAALANGDRQLARVEAQRLDPGSLRTELLEAIDEADEAAKLHSRQRRILAVATAALALALAVGAIAFTRSQAKARAKVEEANKALEQQILRAREARGDAEGMLTFMLGDLRDELTPMGQLPILASVAHQALAYFDRLPESDMTPESLAHKARVLRQIAQVDQSMGSVDEAFASLQSSLELLVRLHTQDPSNLDLQLSEARTRVLLASIYHLRGDLNSAIELNASARRLLESVLATRPDDEVALLRMADVEERDGWLALGVGHLNEAKDHYARALSRLSDRTGTDPQWRRARATNHGNVAYVLRLQGDLEGARREFATSIDMLEAMVAESPRNTEWRRDLAFAYDRMGGVELALGLGPSALSSFESGRDIVDGLVELDPTNAEWRRNLAVAYTRIGEVHRSAGEYIDARDAFNRGLAISLDLAAAAPTNSQLTTHVAWGRTNVADMNAALNESDRALAGYQAALDIRSRLIALEPGNAWWKSDLASSLKSVGSILGAEGEWRAALDGIELAHHFEMNALETDSTNVFWQNCLAQTHILRGRIVRRLGDEGAALAEFDRARAIIDPVVATSGDTRHRTTLAVALLEGGCAAEGLAIVEGLRAEGVHSPEIDALTGDQ